MNTKRTYTPTCPIDRSQVQKIAWARILMGSAVLVVCSFAVAGLLISSHLMSEPLATATSLMAGAAAIVVNATARRPSIENKVVQRLIAASNAEQEKRLWDIVDRLHSPACSVCLSRFINLKRYIESSLHEDGVFTEDKERVEILVDDVVDLVCKEIQAIESLNESFEATFLSGDIVAMAELMQKQDERYRLIMWSMDALRRTSQRFGEVTGPSATIPPVPVEIDRRLEAAILELEENNRVRDRIEKELSDKNLTKQIHMPGPAEESVQRIE